MKEYGANKRPTWQLRARALAYRSPDLFSVFLDLSEIFVLTIEFNAPIRIAQRVLGNALVGAEV